LTEPAAFQLIEQDESIRPITSLLKSTEQSQNQASMMKGINYL